MVALAVRLRTFYLAAPGGFMIGIDHKRLFRRVPSGRHSQTVRFRDAGPTLIEALQFAMDQLSLKTGR